MTMKISGIKKRAASFKSIIMRRIKADPSTVLMSGEPEIDFFQSCDSL